MNAIIKGADFSMWETVGIVIGQCKNENNQGIKSNYAIFTIQDTDGGKPRSLFEFEEDVFPGAVQLLSKYRQLDANNQPVMDGKGGYVVNLKALKASEDAERFKNKLMWAGGVMEWYPFAKGMCIANDRNGNPVKYKDGSLVMADGVNLFCQVKMYIVDGNGAMIPSYLNGMSPAEQGRRIERQFWQKAANGTPVQIQQAQPQQAQQAQVTQMTVPEPPVQPVQQVADPF